MKKSKFRLILNLEHKEFARERNWEQTKLIIENGEINYSYRYYSYPSPRKEKKEYNLNENQINELIEYIKKNNLNRNINEIKPTEGYGISIVVELEIEIEDVKTEVKIIGRKNIWDNEYEEGTNLENYNFYSNMCSLIFFMKKNFGFDFEI